MNTRTKNNSRALGVVASLLGLSTVSLLTFVLTRDSEQVQGPLEETISAGLASMEMQLEELRGLINQLDHRIEAAPQAESLTSGTGLEPNGSNRTEITPAHQTGELGEDDEPEWMTVLDEDLVRVLVERGLSPFNSGTASYVSNAGNALRNIEYEYEDAEQERRDIDKAKGMTYEESVDMLRRITLQRRRARRAVIESLARELDAHLEKSRE